jgi:hypothetical protein
MKIIGYWILVSVTHPFLIATLSLKAYYGLEQEVKIAFREMQGLKRKFVNLSDRFEFWTAWNTNGED